MADYRLNTTQTRPQRWGRMLLPALRGCPMYKAAPRKRGGAERCVGGAVLRDHQHLQSLQQRVPKPPPTPRKRRLGGRRGVVSRRNLGLIAPCRPPPRLRYLGGYFPCRTGGPVHLRLFIILLLALGETAAAPAVIPTCRAAATSSTQRFLPGRLVTVTLAADCPKNGATYIRFRSRTGTQPDAPPGYFLLRRGDQITRRVPWDWWVEERTKGLSWASVLIQKAGQ